MTCARFGILLVPLLSLGCQRDAPQPVADAGPLPTTSASAAPSSAATGTSPPAAPSASAATAEPPFRAEDVTAVVVWQKDDKAKGGFRSQWVERVDGKPSVVAERPGVVVFSSTSAWTLGSTTVKGCSQYKFDNDGDVVVQNGQPVRVNPVMEMPELVRASDGKRVAPWKDGHGYPTVGTQCEPALEDYGVSVRFEGGMGPFVVTSVNYYINAGGAHGIRGQELVTIDLEAGGTKKLSPPERDKPALLQSAAKGLEVEVKEVQYSGLVLMYGPLGAGLALYRYWASAPYVGGLGGNSYSNDFVVTSKNLPPELEPYKTLPGWVAPHLNGKSLNVFMVPPAHMPAMKQQFEAAYSKN